jgi:ParB family transcriptional regulator, chromosome partitioning protein
VIENPRDVVLISISEIVVLNPRARNKKVFSELVTSIAQLGLKKPITVSKRKEGKGYNLVCGQGRMEAFAELGQETVPAIIIDSNPEDSLIMSLVENLARRQHSPLELIKEIGALRKLDYSYSEIAAKTDFSTEYVQAICFLLDHGEEKLLTGVERGIIPPSIALEIVRIKDSEVQEALTDAYERKLLPGNQIVAIRKIIENRDLLGKTMSHGRTQKGRAGQRLSAAALVRAYKKESDRQRAFVRNATLTRNRVVFIIGALKRLLDDEHFVTLLRAEQLATMPRQIADLMPIAGD